MPLEPHQERCLCLAGTVALPAPVPETGSIAFQESETGDLVAVTLHVSPKRAIRWTVRAADLKAFCSDPKSGAADDTTHWYFGEDAVAHLKRAGKARGSIHVSESAQVLLQIEMGVTAAEGTHASSGIASPMGCCPHDDATFLGCCPHESIHEATIMGCCPHDD